MKRAMFSKYFTICKSIPFTFLSPESRDLLCFSCQTSYNLQCLTFKRLEIPMILADTFSEEGTDAANIQFYLDI